MYSDEPRFTDCISAKVNALDIDLSELTPIDAIRLRIVIQYYDDIIRGFSNKEHLSPLIGRFASNQKSVYKEEYRRFLKHLRQARIDAGLTQTEVAKTLRRPQTFVSKAELGERRLDVLEVQEFGKVYGKPLNYFFPKA